MFWLYSLAALLRNIQNLIRNNAWLNICICILWWWICIFLLLIQNITFFLLIYIIEVFFDALYHVLNSTVCSSRINSGNTIFVKQLTLFCVLINQLANKSDLYFAVILHCIYQDILKFTIYIIRYFILVTRQFDIKLVLYCYRVNVYIRVFQIYDVGYLFEYFVFVQTEKLYRLV